MEPAGSPPSTAKDIEITVCREVWGTEGCNDNATRRRIAEQLNITDEDLIYSIGSEISRQIRVRNDLKRMIESKPYANQLRRMMYQMLVSNLSGTDEDKRQAIARFTKTVCETADVVLDIGDLISMV